METRYRQYFFDLRGRLLSGQITMESAEREAAPKIAEMDARARAVARRHSKKWHGFSFASLIRG